MYAQRLWNRGDIYTKIMIASGFENKKLQDHMLILVDHYKSLLSRSAAAFEALVAATGAIETHSSSHNLLVDLGTMKELIADRPESAMIDYAATEYQFALYATAIGHYRHAFAGLRLAMELALAAVSFSANEILYHKWSQSQGDIVWSALVDENGIFSPNFVGCFFPAMKGDAKQYGAIAAAAYRQCSEYVHGNPSTQISDLSQVAFRQEQFDQWHELAKSFHLVLVFAFCARFALLLPSERRGKLQPILDEVLGHLPAIQALANGKTNE